jgi:diaminohydroxyphosphoribosylaminopyrimidine deaminase / 5-amino-6-(5-phosphoribosylamino)uracil reductase
LDTATSALTGDEAFMRLALELAERGRGTTRPNPLVGCAVVRDGEIVGEGWHERAGGPHAEIRALGAAGAAAAGATVYVTLEPCAHTGRTGPCADALVAAGVDRVVYGARDPDPVASGGGEALTGAGVDVRGGVLADEVRTQNEVFFHVHRTGRAHVTLKLAQTLDGRVAAADGSSRWITGGQAREAVHRIRADVDAVAVGSGTVLVDDPQLTVRNADAPLGQPRPVVFDRRGRTPLTARIVRDGALAVTTETSSTAWQGELERLGVEVVVVRDDPDGGVDLHEALAELTARGVHALLVEGGPTLAGSLVRRRLVDRLVLHLAPKVLGGDAVPAIAGPGVRTISEAWRWQILELRRLGDDTEIIARPHG